MSSGAARVTAAASASGLLMIALGIMVQPGAAQTATTITYFIADGTGNAGFRSSDRQLAQWAAEAWQRNASGGLRLEAAAESSALVRLYWVEPNDGRYGEMRPLNVGGKRGAAVFIQPDVGLLDPGIARRASTDALLRDSVVYLTCLHELGHALGLAHTSDFRDIMYFFGYGGDVTAYFDRYRSQLHSREDIAAVSGLSDGDITRLKAIYATAADPPGEKIKRESPGPLSQAR
jgi:hypothetical protein